MAQEQHATTGQSAAHLATPVQLPYEKVLPGEVSDYEILKFTSTWGHEYTVQTETLPATGFTYVQKAGRSCEGIKPYWMLRNTKTNQGIAVALAWSGNWLFEVKPQEGHVLLRAAASPSQLKVFDTINGLPIPGALVSEFTGDWDYGAQPIVHFVREKLRRDMGKDWPPVQYNNWYDGEGVFDEKRLQDAAANAAQLGCELFTMDAGWYGGKIGGDWNHGLGDWTENKERFPSGMEAFAKQVRGLGMKFGLWVEIECASPASPVAKAHPDWFLRAGNRQVSDRAALDFGKPEVVAWAKSVIDDLMSRYKLDYLKMDFNTDMGVDGEQETDGKDPLYFHYRGLVQFLEYIHRKYPQLIVENCSSGSLRADMMTAALSDTHWVSDNVSNDSNLAMDFGATYMFPPEICSHWTVSPSGDNKTMDDETTFTANMAGHLGLSGSISQWSAQTRQIARERIALYKKLRPLLCKADVFHLTPQTNPDAPQSAQASLYVDPGSGKALLFAFHAGDPSLEKTFYLRGLTANRLYHLTMPPGYGANQTVSGKELIERGLTIKFPHAGASAIIQIDPAAS
jgi:alpha-galactosidase